MLRHLTFASLLLLSWCDIAAGQTAENVAVIVNEASPQSRRVGEYYAQKRGVPSANVIRIKTALTETIDRGVYMASIEQPIAAAIGRHSLHDRILYIVLTKGIPLRVAGTGGRNGTLSSVDSELSLLYRRMTGRPEPVNGKIDNPYHLGAKGISEAVRFTHRTHDTFLVTRLDAFTVEEAIELVDRAQSPTRQGRFVLDQRAGRGDDVVDGWLAKAAERLEATGPKGAVFLETSPWPALATPQVLGYFSWGSNDLANRKRKLGMQFVPGALAGTFVSTDARTFMPPPADWVPSADWKRPDRLFAGAPQTLTGDIIREGVTGVAGHVAEPYLDSNVRPDILFPAYVAGFNLAEAFYLALPHLSWQTIVIGDPLCAPFPRTSLTRTDIEAGISPSTELPALFSARRMEVARLALKNAPLEAVALAVRAENQLGRNDTAAARTSLEKAAELAPGVASLQLQLAMLHESTGAYGAAIARYRAALKSEPANALALNNLAYALAIRQNALDEAAGLAERAVKLAPNDPTVLDTLGWIEHLRGNTAVAAKWLAEATRRGTARAEIHLHAAIVYAESGAWAASETRLADALRLDPSLATGKEVARLRERLAVRR